MARQAEVAPLLDAGLSQAEIARRLGVTRQTIHNLFGTKTAVLEALFDVIALDGGMEKMREAMTQLSGNAMLAQFVHIFCGFWAPNRLLFRRIHGIAAIDPEFGAVIEARNRRRLVAATRIVRKMGATQKVGQLACLTVFASEVSIGDNDRIEHEKPSDG